MNELNTVNTIARVNGVVLNSADETLSNEELRQRACTELLRQAAMAGGLLDPNDVAPNDGVISEAATQAIEAWLERAISVPEPSEEACLRHHAANLARYSTGEQIHMRHILFAVTPGMNLGALRNRAETCLIDVRCHDGKTTDGFAVAARELSNCPSAELGGDLGWLNATDCAPEFARELFGHVEVGVLPRLVHSRFGLHVVEVLARQAGKAQTFDNVRGAVAMALRQQAFITALRQYLQLLAGKAVIEGVELESADTPLLQ